MDYLHPNSSTVIIMSLAPPAGATNSEYPKVSYVPAGDYPPSHHSDNEPAEANAPPAGTERPLIAQSEAEPDRQQIAQREAEPENVEELMDLALSRGNTPETSRMPVTATCPHCHATKKTHTAYKSGEIAWKSCLVLCLCCWCCFPIMFCPFCCSACKDVEHTCEQCGKVVGKCKLSSLAKD